MSETKFIAVAEDEAGMRIDKLLSSRIGGMTRSHIQKLIDDGRVTVSDKAVKANYKVKCGDAISITIPEPTKIDVRPEDIPLDIVYEDRYMLVVNKPQGMVVHPAPGSYDKTLVNALLHHCGTELSGINGVLRPGILHRIDKDTSGLLLVAKCDAAHTGLAEQIKEHSLTRAYLALVHGGFSDGDFLFSGSTITTVTNWQDMQVNDPARDLAWIFGKLDESHRNAVLSAYGRMMAYMNYTPRTLDELLEANPQPMIERTRKDGTNAGENSNGEL